MMIQKTGYRTDTFFSNIALGITDGIDGALWAYVFATIIFSGALSVFLPVGLLIILGGWAIVSLLVTVTSKLKVHVVAIDEQAVVIFGSIGLLLAANLGIEASTSKGLATILAVMSITSFLIALVLFLAARFQIARLLELLPFPVICGYMAGIAWLLLDAGVFISIDAPISFDLWQILEQENNLLKLVLSMLGGIGLIVFMNRFEQAWALPLASVLIVLGFYSVAYLNGMSKSDLVAGGWIYDIQIQPGDVKEMLFSLSFSDINTSFIISVIPQILTIVFLTMLSASMNLSIMAATNPKIQISTTEEMQGLSAGNFLLGFIGCPPGYSDAVTSSLYEGFGASSRWMAIASSLVCLLVLFVGTSIISYLPNVLICSSIFLFAFQMFYDWMYENVRSFTVLDYGIICAILITVIAFGFMQGVLFGVFLTVFLFVLRYSMITAILGKYTLDNHRSSVERSTSCNRVLNRHGAEALVYTLRGFLFFGTVNSVRDSIYQAISKGGYTSILFDFRRVTGIDISALNMLVQIRQFCEGEGIQILYSGAIQEIDEKLLSFDVASAQGEQPLVFSEADLALESMEDTLLAKYVGETSSGSVYEQLVDILGCTDKAQLLFDMMEKSDLQSGQVLFRQGDADNGFYILESGSMTARLEIEDGSSIRVKKFSAGSVIGEISNYTLSRARTASVVANEPSTLYQINLAKLDNLSEAKTPTIAAIHELVARTLSLRIEYMNKRLMLELT
jgi:SulP family sulfate permease